MKTTKTWVKWAVCGAIVACIANLAKAEGEHRIGAGANYWVAVRNIDADNVKDNGFSYLASYQYRRNLLGLELDAEFLPDRFGRDAWAPAAYLLIGKTVYAGAGIGVINSDNDFASEPFYAIRAGLDLEVHTRIHLDISGNYRFNDKAQLEGDNTNIDTDTVFLGAAVRITL
jgi:hypothetical protein